MSSIFNDGGFIPRGKLYIERPADDLLYDQLSHGELCFVLAPRQIGKSSLKERVGWRLAAGGIHCVKLDLGGFGTQVPEEQWYYGLISEIADQLGIGDPHEYWKQHVDLPPVQRWIKYLKKCILTDPKIQQIVLFIDEIDTIRTAHYSGDDFLASIRALYNDRATSAACARLTFCLLGVASPADLIHNQTDTPFNIGRSIPLEDFTRAQMAAFKEGLQPLATDPDALLDAIYHWAGGHPYMTQRICISLEPQGQITGQTIDEAVSAVVDRLFAISTPARRFNMDINLSTAESCFARTTTFPRPGAMLKLYARLLANEQIPADSNDGDQNLLRLTGLASVRSEGASAWMRVRNHIFASIFNAEWVKKKQLERRMREPYDEWLRYGRSEKLLLQGTELQRAQDWVQQSDDILSEEHQFLRLSEQASNRKRNQQRLIGIAGAFVVGALIVGLIFLIGMRKAERQAAFDEFRRKYAEQNTQKESGLRASLLANQPGQRLSALAVAMQAVWPNHLLTPPDPWQPPREAQNGLLAVLTAPVIMSSRQLSIPTGWARSAVFSPDGRYIAVCGYTGHDAPAQIMDMNGAPPVALRGHAGAVVSVAFSPDGKRLITASDDGTARIWQVKSGKILLTLDVNVGKLQYASFSPDGKQIITTSVNGSVSLWDASTGIHQLLLSGHRQAVNFASFSPDCTQIATASDDHTIRLWETRSGRPLLTLEGHTEGVTTAVFSANGKQLLTASMDGTSRLWGVRTGQLEVVFDDRSGLGTGNAIRSAFFSPDGTQIVTAGSDHTVRIWNVQQRATQLTLEGHTWPVLSASFAPDGMHVVSVDRYGIVLFWNLRERPLVYIDKPSSNWDFPSFSPNGARVVLAGSDGTAAIWSTETGQLQLVLEDSIDRGTPVYIRTAEFCLGGKRILTANTDNTVRLWNSTDGSKVQDYLGHEGPVGAASCSPDGTKFATSGGDKIARLWELDSGRELAVMRGHKAAISAQAFSHDGATLATASTDGTVRLWQVSNAQILRVLALRTTPLVNGISGPASLQFSPDDQQLLVLLGESVSEVWDVKAGVRLFELLVEDQQGTQRPRFAEFYANGSEIVGSLYNSLVFWSVPQGTWLRTLQTGVSNILSMRGDPTNRVFLLGNRTEMMLFPPTIQGLYAAGCKILDGRPTPAGVEPEAMTRLKTRCAPYLPTEVDEFKRQEVDKNILKAPPIPQYVVNGLLEGPTGSGRVVYLGADVNPAALGPAKFVTLTHYFQVEVPPPPGWRLFVHLAHEGVQNSHVNKDHVPVNGTYPVDQWKKGEIIRDIHEIEIPANWKSGQLEVYVGLWYGAERFSVKSGPSDGANRLRAISLPLVQKDDKERPQAAAKRLLVRQLRPGETITVDGELNEQAWKNASSTGLFVDSRSGLATDQASEAKILWDKNNLYLAFAFSDRDIWATMARRDDALWLQDSAELRISRDPPGRASGGYLVLNISPRNITSKPIYRLAGGGDTELDLPIKSSVRVRGTLNQRSDVDKGWIVELQIPLNAVNTPFFGWSPKVGVEWSANFYRTDILRRGGKVISSWSPHFAPDFSLVDRFGTLQFANEQGESPPLEKEYILNGPPSPRFPAQALLQCPEGDGQLVYLGSDVEDPIVTQERPIKLTHYFQVNKPLPSGWNVFVEFADGEGGLQPIMRDHIPGEREYPVHLWKAGTIVRDIHEVNFPWIPSLERLKLSVGLHKGELHCATTNAIGATADSVLVATLPVRSMSMHSSARPELALTVRQLDSGTHITIDGRLDESAWHDSQATGLFVQSQNGQPLSDHVQARALWDDQNLYLGFDIMDKDIVSRQGPHDGPLWNQDVAEVFIDASQEGKNYLVSRVTPNNVTLNTFYSRFRQADGQWNGVINTAVQIDGTVNQQDDVDKGWTVEMQIPLEAIKGRLAHLHGVPPRIGAQWRANFYRKSAKSPTESGAWSPPLGADFHATGKFGTLLFTDKWGKCGGRACTIAPM